MVERDDLTRGMAAVVEQGGGQAVGAGAGVDAGGDADGAPPHSLRHAGVSLWLASGVDATEVARRAGHSVAVLYRFYAKVLHGVQEQANERIERALGGAE
jgi:integrase